MGSTAWAAQHSRTRTWPAEYQARYRPSSSPLRKRSRVPCARSWASVACRQDGCQRGSVRPGEGRRRADWAVGAGRRAGTRHMCRAAQQDEAQANGQTSTASEVRKRGSRACLECGLGSRHLVLSLALLICSKAQTQLSGLARMCRRSLQAKQQRLDAVDPTSACTLSKCSTSSPGRDLEALREEEAESVDLVRRWRSSDTLVRPRARHCKREGRAEVVSSGLGWVAGCLGHAKCVAGLACR